MRYDLYYHRRDYLVKLISIDIEVTFGSVAWHTYNGYVPGSHTVNDPGGRITDQGDLNIQWVVETNVYFTTPAPPGQMKCAIHLGP